MMDLFNQFVEMMGDLEFALSVGIFIFSVVLFLGLVGKLVGTKPAGAPVTKGKDPLPPLAPDQPKGAKDVPSTETFLASVEKKNNTEPSAASSVVDVNAKKETGPVKDSGSKDSKKDAPAVASAPAIANSLEGAMMWDGDSGKKKKGKTPPAPAVTPARVLPPGYVDPNAAASKEKESEKTVVLSAPPAVSVSPASAEPQRAPVSPTVPASTQPSPAPVAAPVEPKPSVSVPPKSESTLVSKAPVQNEAGDSSDGKPSVDFHMYETLVRRIAGVESEIKKDPLYLDPLMRRVSSSERKLEELSEKVKAPGPKMSAESAGPVPVGLETEMKGLKEKVERLEKLLDQLSEGPAGGPNA